MLCDKCVENRDFLLGTRTFSVVKSVQKPERLVCLKFQTFFNNPTNVRGAIRSIAIFCN